jgi:hypothetical protein
VQAYASDATDAAFAASHARFAQLVDWLAGDQAAGMTHAQLEEHLHADGLELLRQLLQDSLELRAVREQRLAQVTDADGYQRGSAEQGRQRLLATVFGQVTVRRIAYRQRGRADLHPADAQLNLPIERHSHGLRRLAALEAARGSFDDAAQAIGRATGVTVAKRQVEELATRAAVDVDAFYTHRDPTTRPDSDVLVLTFDGKGIVMRPEALREATAHKAAARKLAGRLSKGEKRHRKRMAELACVYDLTPTPRTVADILPDSDADRASARPAPVAAGKWLHASVTDDAAAVIAAGFDQATRRDPDHRRDWVVLVDGNTHQLDRVRAEARTRSVKATIVVDVVHVLEYLWRAAWCFYREGDPAAEQWVCTQATRSWPAAPASWLPRSAARPPTTGWAPASAATPTPPPPTCWPRSPTWTTPPPSPRAGPSPPASSKAPAAIWSKTAWTSPAPAGALPAPKPSSSSAP